MTWDYRSPAKHRKPRARAKAAFRNMKQRCGNANGKNPGYTDVKLLMTEEEWLTWAVPKFEGFQADHPAKSPCVSRLEDMGHYELNNIEIISTDENRRRQKAVLLLRPNNTKLCSNCRVPKAGDAFNRNRRRPDGLDHRCRECVRLKRKPSN